MKKIFGALIIAIYIAMTMPTQAQTYLGVKGGSNLSKASFSNISESFKKGSFTGFFTSPMAELNTPVAGLGVDTSSFLAQWGIKVPEGNDDITVKQDGIDILINLKCTIGLGNLAGTYLAAGPDFYFDFEKKSRIDKKKAEIGVSVGVGLKLLNHLQVGVDYDIPLGDTVDIEGVGASYKAKIWQVLVAYIF